MSASATAKEKHYWSQLRAALTAGQWLADFPAKTPQASQLSWSELFRKFNKHCRGFHDVSEVASQTYGLALLLASNSLNEDEDYADVRDFSVELGDESILPPERVEEVSQGYETLKKLQSANSDVRRAPMSLYTVVYNFFSTEYTLCSCVLCLRAWPTIRLPHPPRTSPRLFTNPDFYTQCRHVQIEHQ